MRLGTLLLSMAYTLFSPNLALATKESECTSIDVRKEVGPIRDQGNIGWCYANAAADLLSFEYRTQLNHRQASAMHMALTYTDSYMADLPVIGKSFFEGGSLYLALKSYSMRHKSVCLQAPEDSTLTKGILVKRADGTMRPLALKEKLKELMHLKSTFDDYAKDRSKKAAFQAQWRRLYEAKSHLFSMGNERLIELLAYTSKRDFPHEVADELCKDHSIPVKQNSEPTVLATLRLPNLKNVAIDQINDQLHMKNIVGLTYQASVLTTPDVSTDIESAHVSVLVGRRWNKNKCEYLIRNSWGKGCYAYKNSPVFKERCEGDGHVWIPEDIMKKSMMGISYFDKSPSLIQRATNLISSSQK